MQIDANPRFAVIIDFKTNPQREMKKPFSLKFITTTLLLSSAISASAQRISGTVTDSIGNPIANASVTEVDANHRVLSNTRTDGSGNFNMQLRSMGNTRIRISADGYKMLSKRSERGQKQTFLMAKKTASQLSIAEKANQGFKRNHILTEKLFCGRSGATEVPWTVMLEQIGDTTFVLRMPVKASAMNATYNEGRSVTFVDWGESQLLMSYNGEDCPAIGGYPNERSTWKYVTDREDVMHDMHRDYGGSTSESIYFYPAFMLTLDEVNTLIKEADHLGRLLIDTEQADNVWFMYPRASFSKELSKVLKKLQDTATKSKERKK